MAIGNEIRLEESEPNKPQPRVQNEPVAAARMMEMNAQLFHQFTNLKILKSDDDDGDLKRMLEKERLEKQHQKKEDLVHLKQKEEKSENQNKVLSQV